MDLAWTLWREGYRAVPEERARHDGEDAFETRLLGRRALVVRGPDGARSFYDESLVRRRGAIPPPLAALLFGRGAVHGLDDDAHKERKALHLGLLTDERTRPLAAAIGEALAQRTRSWRGDVVVFDELVEVYGTAVLAWAGIELSPEAARRVSRRLAWIVDGFGFAPLAYARGWGCRLWADRWARGLIEEVRRGASGAPSESPLAALAASDLPARVAAVELINLLRPTVAVAWLGTFTALALAEHPQWRGLLDDRARAVAFAHEVRRRYPFVPVLAGRVRRAGDVLGHRVRAGQMLVLDVDGTDHDPTRWDDAQGFRPERFAGIEPDPFGFVPQGGGDVRTGHRCPGEPLTVMVLAETARVLAEVPYEVVAGEIRLDRIPTLPAERLRVRVPHGPGRSG